MEAQYKRLYEITERENRRLTKIVEVQKDMIEGLTKEKEMLKAAYNALNKELEEVLSLCDQQQLLLEDIAGQTQAQK
jgi:peptidoglycan hydrolase CwlO-like protein